MLCEYALVHVQQIHVIDLLFSKVDAELQAHVLLRASVSSITNVIFQSYQCQLAEEDKIRLILLLYGGYWNENTLGARLLLAVFVPSAEDMYAVDGMSR